MSGRESLTYLEERLSRLRRSPGTRQILRKAEEYRARFEKEVEQRLIEDPSQKEDIELRRKNFLQLLHQVKRSTVVDDPERLFKRRHSDPYEFPNQLPPINFNFGASTAENNIHLVNYSREPTRLAPGKKNPDLLTESDNTDEETGQTMADIFKLADTILPREFDGTPSKLTSFLDALELFGGNLGTCTQENAVRIIKTRLSGKARDLITNEETVQGIIDTLKKGIKIPTSAQVAAKLLAVKQTATVLEYAKEVESLAEQLRRSYLSERIPLDTAESLVAQQTTLALVRNARTERVQTIMEAGSFKSSEEAITKFVASASSTASANVAYTRRSQQNNRRSG